jgi:anion-transporting  ArsA/GET3 family ATPase
MGMASRGLKVAVVTIDPAKRLADALGLGALDNDPRRVEGDFGDGELWALMLDVKRTFDGLIERVAPNDASRDEVLSNRIYQELSSAVAGTQEFTAIARLYDLDAEGDYDLLVLDTPPSRNALDFLDAPDRLSGFFQGRAIRLFLRPAGIGGKVFGAGTGAVFSILKKVTGVDLLQDLSVFFRSMGGMIDEITERATRVKALLRDPGTTFLIVTAPERDPATEAAYFHGRLREQSLPFGGLVLNKVRESPELEEELPSDVAQELGEDLAGRVQLAAAELALLAERDASVAQDLRRRLGDPPTIRVPQLPDDVHDADGLAAMCRHLFAPA